MKTISLEKIHSFSRSMGFKELKSKVAKLLDDIPETATNTNEYVIVNKNQVKIDEMILFSFILTKDLDLSYMYSESDIEKGYSINLFKGTKITMRKTGTLIMSYEDLNSSPIYESISISGLTPHGQKVINAIIESECTNKIETK